MICLYINLVKYFHRRRDKSFKILCYDIIDSYYYNQGNIKKVQIQFWNKKNDERLAIKYQMQIKIDTLWFNKEIQIIQDTNNKMINWREGRLYMNQSVLIKRCN